MDNQERLANARRDFCERWAPADEHDFEVAVDRLIYAAFSAAQEPFVGELKLFRALKPLLLIWLAVSAVSAWLLTSA